MKNDDIIHDDEREGVRDIIYHTTWWNQLDSNEGRSGLRLLQCMSCSSELAYPITVLDSLLYKAYGQTKVGRGRFMKIGLTRFKLQTYFLMSRPNLGLNTGRLDQGSVISYCTSS